MGTFGLGNAVRMRHQLVGLAARGEDAVPKNARASKTGAVLHRLVRRRVQNGPLTAVDSTEERRGRLRFSRREIEPRRELDTRFSVRVREWKSVLSLVSREHRVDDDENWRRRVRGLARVA